MNADILWFSHNPSKFTGIKGITGMATSIPHRVENFSEYCGSWNLPLDSVLRALDDIMMLNKTVTNHVVSYDKIEDVLMFSATVMGDCCGNCETRPMGEEQFLEKLFGALASGKTAVNLCAADYAAFSLLRFVKNGVIVRLSAVPSSNQPMGFYLGHSMEKEMIFTFYEEKIPVTRELLLSPDRFAAIGEPTNLLPVDTSQPPRTNCGPWGNCHPPLPEWLADWIRHWKWEEWISEEPLTSPGYPNFSYNVSLNAHDLYECVTRIIDFLRKELDVCACGGNNDGPGS